jgi:hypothetical protein
MPVATLAHKQALYSLAKLYTRRACERWRPKGPVAVIRTEIEQVAAVILLLEPRFDLTGVKPLRRSRSNPLFRKGPCSRLALEVLRGADRPMTTREIALAVPARLGVPEPSWLAMRNMVPAVHLTLRHGQGKTVEGERDNGVVRWWLKP